MRIAIIILVATCAAALLALLAYAVRSSRIRSDLGYDNDPSNDPEVGHRGLRPSIVVRDEAVDDLYTPTLEVNGRVFVIPDAAPHE